jgi:superfamily II DNA/RNA helicase
MPTNFFTNSEDNSLIKKFEGTLINNPGLRFFDALVGYFRASGYFKVRPFLEQIPKIRILVGINVDMLTKKYQEKGLLYLESSEETKETFLNEIIENIQKSDYNKDTEEGILQFLQDIISEKIEMRAHPTMKIHAKVYIFKSAVFNEYAPCEVITGSSNLTDSGLGTNPNSNYEFNVSLKNYDDVKFASDEFEKLWGKSVPILHAEAEKIKNKTYLKDDFTPFELYIKMLIEYFGKRVEYDPYNIDLLLPDKFIRLKYQSDAANQGYAIMMKHNGIILADVVGLGKTIIACMIAKKYIYENGTHTRILIVLPPALVAGWKSTTEDFQIKNHFEFVTTGSLDKVLKEDNFFYSNADKFDMVIIDEAHKFRNDYTEMYVALQEICKRPRSKPSESGDTRKKVMLISATPLNNRPQDIENQLYLFQDRRNSTLENIRNLQEYFKPVNEQYKRLAAEETLNIPSLKRLFQQLRNDVIEPLVIRRTRTDIENNEDYLEDLKTQNIIFPKVGDPIPLYYQLKGSLSNLFFDTVSLITGIDENGNQVEGLGYYRYRAIEFLENDDDRRIYGNVGLISNRLSAIMRTLLVKRLESSFHSFKKSLIRLQTALLNMLTMFADNRIFIAPDLDINKLLAEGYSYDEIEEKINQKGENNKEFSKNDFTPEFYKHLLNDKAQIDFLVERWEGVRYDPKLTEFINQLKDVFFNPERNHSGKLVIFTEAKETAEELAERIRKTGRREPLLISSENRKEMESVIRLNFDANIEEDKWKDDYNILITTEVLAEGVNLHRCNIVVNYDVPWNSTRLMQRIGRVNRIGSRAENIYVYNFYPSSQGDAQIQLVDTALRKLQSFHTAFG